MNKTSEKRMLNKKVLIFVVFLLILNIINFCWLNIFDFSNTVTNIFDLMFRQLNDNDLSDVLKALLFPVFIASAVITIGLIITNIVAVNIFNRLFLKKDVIVIKEELTKYVKIIIFLVSLSTSIILLYNCINNNVGVKNPNINVDLFFTMGIYLFFIIQLYIAFFSKLNKISS